MSRSVMVMTLLSLWFALTAHAAFAAMPKPPHHPQHDYLASSCVEKQQAVAASGLKYWLYVPNRLRHKTHAPVVIFLHGFGSQDPRYYLLHLRHLCLQGNLVIFPQYLASDLGGKIVDAVVDADQYKFLTRAVDAVDQALIELGTQADSDDITIYGHSVGGLLALAWSQQAFSPRRIVLANPAIESPDFVKKLAHYTPIDWRAAAAAVTCPVWILTGDSDSTTPSAHAIAIYDRLVNAAARAVYMAHSDDRGSPPLQADHEAAQTVHGQLPIMRMILTGTSGEVSAINTRFYWPALDAAVAGESEISFDMGAWSDGVPVHPVMRIR